jgi:hypothetical protein
MKGGIPTTDEAFELNKSTLCKYYAFTSSRYSEDIEKRKTEKEIEDAAKNLMLYRIDFTEPDPRFPLRPYREKQWPVSKYPNPMSIQAIINEKDPDLLFLYADPSMGECTSSVM